MREPDNASPFALSLSFDRLRMIGSYGSVRPELVEGPDYPEPVFPIVLSLSKEGQAQPEREFWVPERTGGLKPSFFIAAVSVCRQFQ